MMSPVPALVTVFWCLRLYVPRSAQQRGRGLHIWYMLWYMHDVNDTRHLTQSGNEQLLAHMDTQTRT